MKAKLPYVYLKEIIAITYIFICNEAVARGGQGGDASLFFGLIGVGIAFLLCKVVGEALSPSSKSSDQIILGFVINLFGIALLLSIFK